MIEDMFCLCVYICVLSAHYNINFRSCWQISGKLIRCRNLEVYLHVGRNTHPDRREGYFINSHNEAKIAGWAWVLRATGHQGVLPSWMADHGSVLNMSSLETRELLLSHMSCTFLVWQDRLCWHLVAAKARIFTDLPCKDALVANSMWAPQWFL